MKYFTFLILALIFCFTPLTHVHAAFAQYRSITVNSSQVPTTQTNFPMLVSGTYSYLATVANGGKVQNTSGYDVGFYSNSNCSIGKLNWETEKYVATTGEVDYWINIASISNGTVIYMCYGDVTISTDQSNKTAVWDANFKAVYHLPDGTTLTANDSTSAANTGTIAGATATAGQMDGAANFVAASSQYISNGFANQPQGNSSLTSSAWVKFAANATTYDITTFFGLDSASSKSAYFLYRSPSGKATTEFGSGYGNATGLTTLVGGTWYYITATYDGSNNKIYVNGTVEATTAFSSGNLGGNALYIGAYYPAPGPTLFTNGIIDEARISNIARSANWILTEYNNQNSPSTFYTIGSSLPASSTIIHKFILSKNFKFIFKKGYTFLFK